MKEILQQNKRLITFLLYTGLLYGGWLITYEYFLKPWGVLDQLITENISYFLCVGLDWMGYNPHYSIARHVGETFIFIGSEINPIIRVGSSCNGLELLVLFAIFVICYPSKKQKLIFILFGLILIHAINIIRNFILTIMAIHKSPYFDFFHRYIFVFLVYGIIFLLWIWWTNYQNNGTEKK